MSHSPQSSIKAANRKLYDAVAERYEEIDGRRSPKLEEWLRGKLAGLRGRAPGGRLLDLGAGSGLVARCAEGLFVPRVAVDLSPGILVAHRSVFEWAVAGDVDRLPFADGSFDLVTSFAVLHHLSGFERLVPEVARVLAPSGLFYSDHDMDAVFQRRFRLPLSFYRKLRNAESKYRAAGLEVTPELYQTAERHEEGVDTSSLLRTCRRAGLAVEARFHWFGLSPVTDRLFGLRSSPRGWAPLLSLVAIKQGAGR